MTPQEKEEIDQLLSGIDFSIWQPNPDHPDGTPNPQRLGYESKADILGYGGAGGGGKTDLLLGLAKNKHKNSIIFRRVFKNLRGIVERSREIFNPDGTDKTKDSYNEQLHRWQLSDGKQVEFEAMQYEKDKENFRGRPHDLYCFDEATEFTRSQVEFVMAWMRSTDPNQRCRAVLTFNPPVDEGGSWIIDFFLPWIAYLFPNEYTHPNPAAPGELRWYATIDGEETECENERPFDYNGETIKPMSRTFIPAKLADNPHLDKTGYRSILQSLPEPLRSQMLHGDFAAAKSPNPWQVIPTAWVKLAQARWLEREKPDAPLAAVGVDVARGGRDKLSIARRYDNWFAEIVSHPGVNVEDGPAAAELVRKSLGDEEPGYINVDVIGVGTSAYDSLKVVYNTIPINASGASNYRDRSGKLKMRNKRAEYHWRMREALDPEHGDDLALPPGNAIVADLCAATYTPTAAGIQIEPKDKIKERIGRSPDEGEAILLAYLGSTDFDIGFF